MCVLASLCVFYPSRHYGMVTDFINWIYKYENGSFADVMHCFDYPGLHQFFHFVNFTIYKVISTNTIAWYMILSIMHGLNVFVIFKLGKEILNYFGNEKLGTQWLAVVAFLFLIFPYNIETVIWKACLHYMITLQCLLLGFFFLLKYWKSINGHLFLFIIHSLFVVALFTLELSFIFPFIYLSVIIGHRLIRSDSDFKGDVVNIFLPQVILLCIYIFLSKMALGNYIGHYGAEKHLVFDLNLIFSNGWKYFFKNFMFLHFYSFHIKAFLYEKLLTNIWVIYGLSIGVIALVVNAYKSKSQYIVFLTVNLILFFLALAPILTLYFYWMHPFENDRYGYFASIFFIVFVVSILYKIPNDNFRKLFLILYLGINIFYFINVIFNANEAVEVQHSLLSNFEIPATNDTIVILGMPDNYNGMYMFRDHKKNAHILRKSLSMMYDKDFDNTIIDVAQFNQINLTDGLSVNVVRDRTLRVAFNQAGNWFWDAGVGLSNYETELFKVEVKSGYYDLIFKNQMGNYIFLYTDNNKWVTFEVD